MRWPSRISLLRGNHECRQITVVYGFYDEVFKKYLPTAGPSVWEAFQTVFDALPLAAIVDKSILCMHGGLSPMLTSLDAVRSIDRVVEIPHEVCFHCPSPLLFILLFLPFTPPKIPEPLSTASSYLISLSLIKSSSTRIHAPVVVITQGPRVRPALVRPRRKFRVGPKHAAQRRVDVGLRRERQVPAREPPRAHHTRAPARHGRVSCSCACVSASACARLVLIRILVSRLVLQVSNELIARVN